MTRRGRIAAVTLIAAGLLSVPEPAAAYVGPGAGLTIIGAALAFVGGVVLAVLGFFWYPIKRLLGLRKKDTPAAEPTEE